MPLLADFATTGQPRVSGLPRLRGPWGLVKPLPGSTINWGHPLAQGLISCWLLNEQGGRPRDIASGQASSAGGTAGTAVPGGWAKWTPEGMSFSNGFNNNELWYSPLPRTGGTNHQIPVTIQTRIKIAGSTAGTAFGIGDSTATGNGSGLQLAIGNTTLASSGTNLLLLDAGQAVLNVFTGVPTGTWFDAMVTAYATTGAGSYEVWLNGRSVTTGNLGGLVTTHLYSNLGGGGAAGNFNVGYGRIWSRSLTKDERQWLQVEPYAFLDAPGPRRSYTFFSAPTTVPVVKRQTGWGKQKPPAGTPLNVGDPITRDLHTHVSFGSVRPEIIQQAPFIGPYSHGGQNPGTALTHTVLNTKPTSHGMGTVWTGAGLVGTNGISVAGTNWTGAWTLRVLVSVSADPTGTPKDVVTMTESAGSAVYDHSVGVSTNGTFYAYFFDGGPRSVNGTTANTNGRVYDVIATCSSSGLLELWVDGRLEGGYTGLNTGYTGYTSPELMFGTGANGQIACTTVTGTRWNRALTAAEIERLYVEPYAMFAPPSWPRTFSLEAPYVAPGNLVTGGHLKLHSS